MDINLIRDEFKKSGYNVSRTARTLDLDYDMAKELLNPEVPPLKGPTTPKPADFRQLGKVGMRRWVVAVRSVLDIGWGEEARNAILIARRRHEAGTHDMCQETRDGWNILYCIPRKNPEVNRKPWFFRKDYE